MTEREIVTLQIPGCLHGRRKIFTNARSITPDNVVDVLNKALAVHERNKNECEYLYTYYRGVQDIQSKQKLVRPEINNKVTVNLANAIVAFKTAYFNTAPIQYVSSGGEDSVSRDVDLLGKFMRAEDKDSKDKEICDWFHICGVAPRMCLPDPEESHEGSPACIYTLDPRDAFVVYYSGIGQRPMLNAIRQYNENDELYWSVYAGNAYYEIQRDKIIRTEKWPLSNLPVVEYLNNEARMGAFEVVLPLLNAINVLSSNRVDSVQDFVNAFDVFQNCELEDGVYSELSKGGMAIQIKSSTPGVESKVYRIASELNQAGVQQAIDDMYTNVLSICGMPSQSGSTASTSDTGAAAIMRDGWFAADARANDTEKLFNRAERQFLKLFLEICRNTTEVNLGISDIKIEHSRNNLSNIQSRMQILCEGLNNDKIHPKVAWLMSGMPNAEEFYRMSQQYYEEEQERLAESLSTQTNGERVTEEIVTENV